MEIQKKNNQRESNFELLRIVAMFGIVLFHYSDHGCGDITYDNALAVNAMFEYFCRIGGGLGNCIFMILTGYFMSKSEFKVKKLVKIWSQVFFYSVLSYIVACSIEVTCLVKKDFIEALLPITSNQYWYFTAYIIIFFMSPAINIAFERLDKMYILIIMAGLLYFFSIMPVLGYYSVISNDRIGVMVLLYAIGAYIRKYHSEKSRVSLRIELFVTIILLILISSCIIFYDKFSILQSFFGDRFSLVWGIEKTPIIIFSTVVFLVFKNLNIGSHSIINWIAASAFGVYLIHMNNWTTNIIWDKICRTKDYYQSLNMIAHVLICCVLIYIICTGIDKVRIYIIERPLEKAACNISKIKSKVTVGIACVVIVMIVIYISGLRLLTPLNSSLSYKNNSSIVMLQEGTELTESFYNKKTANLKQILFHTITWDKVFEENQMLIVSIRDVDSHELVFSQEICLNYFSDQGDYELLLSDEVRLEKNHWYSLEFTTNTIEGQETMALMLTNVSENERAAYINGEESSDHVSAVVATKMIK